MPKFTKQLKPKLMKNTLKITKCCDQKGIELKTEDVVKILDIEGLEDCKELKESTTLIVTKLLDLESNYMEFISNNILYEFYGFRVIKINS